ncbi:MAG: hypothetical protein K6C05_08790 [Anaerovibrio sp.]|uniref:hypothetical protein n=1 Tax=Anaerovibrio sp. TaxID=1872532 RepID=UPI0025D8F8A2|nr:hypothetical protein [Anaerovibrio sp.]MCR5176928.1 hypothetical protein [Anaerovibrio sp.]
MASQAKTIEQFIMNQPENKILTANLLFRQIPTPLSEQAFYQTLTRLTRQGILRHLTKGIYYRPRYSRFGEVPLCEEDILGYYTNDGKGMVIGYRLYQKYGITTQISKKSEVLSNVVQESTKTVGNVRVSQLKLQFTEEICRAITVLEILQNYRQIEEFNRQSLAAFMKKYAANYSEEAMITVIQARKYKKSTIAFLVSFLGYWKVKNMLHQYLSNMSTYSIPKMEEFYASA